MTQLIGITSNGKSHRNKEVFQKYNEICLEINCINQSNLKLPDPGGAEGAMAPPALWK